MQPLCYNVAFKNQRNLNAHCYYLCFSMLRTAARLFWSKQKTPLHAKSNGAVSYYLHCVTFSSYIVYMWQSIISSSHTYCSILDAYQLCLGRWKVVEALWLLSTKANCDVYFSVRLITIIKKLISPGNKNLLFSQENWRLNWQRKTLGGEKGL